MKQLIITVIYLFLSLTTNAQREPYGFTADFSFLRMGDYNPPIQGFTTTNIGAYFNPKLMKRKVEVGMNSIIVKDYETGSTKKFENHLGLRVNYLFRNKTNLVPYIGAGLFYTINHDGENLEAANRGSSFKGFAGVRYHFKDWFFLKGEMGNYRYDFEIKGFAIHPTLGLGFSL